MSVLKWLRLRSRPANDNPAPHTDETDIVNRNMRLLIRTPGNVEAGLLAENGTPVQAVARVFQYTGVDADLDGDVFGIGDYYWELNASDGVTPSNAGADPVKAQGTITVGAVGVATETFAIAGVTYTFRAIADYDAAGEVGIPASGDLSAQANYIATAINGGDGFNVANAFVTAEAVGATVVVTAKNVGSGGDALGFTEAGASLVMDAATLGATTAGVDPEYFPVDLTAAAVKSAGTITLSAGGPVADEVFAVGATTYTFKAIPSAAGEVALGGNLLQQAVNIIAAIMGTDGFNTANASASAAGGGAGVVIVTALTGGTAGDAIVFTETATGLVVDGAGTLGTTVAGTDSEDSETATAIAAAITAGTAPFTGVVAAINNVTITSTLFGIDPNGYPIHDGFTASAVAQTVAGVEGTPGIQGCLMEDGSYIYVLVTGVEATKQYAWERSATASY